MQKGQLREVRAHLYYRAQIHLDIKLIREIGLENSFISSKLLGYKFMTCMLESTIKVGRPA